MAASRAMVNVISALTMSGLAAETLSNLYKDSGRKTIPDLCEKAWNQIKYARSLWAPCTRQETEIIAKKIDYFRGKAAVISLIECTSIALALLDEVEWHIKDERKRKAIADLSKTVFRIQKYYDRRLSRNEEYEKAAAIVSEWLKAI